MRFFRVLMMIGIVVTFCGCAVYSHKDICEPGSQEVCECEDGLAGGKTCWSNAKGWTECDCSCQPDCSGLKCGPEPVCGYSCGSCPQGQACQAGQCSGCEPDCKDLECGPDPLCGSSCGSCPQTRICQDGKCVECRPDCLNRECGPDPICSMSCGACAAGESCDRGHCLACVPDCTNRECGPDSNCGLSCGVCPAGETCVNGRCGGCVPDCTNRECGLDANCGQSCGTCEQGYDCRNGRCRPSNAGLGSPCPNGSDDCPDDFPICLSGAGLTYCSNVCDNDADCGGPPNCCDDLGSGLFCWDPSLCPGWSDVGEACPFDEVNATADTCKTNLYCLGMWANGESGFCPDGDVSECESIPAVWNPDCVDGKCGASFCAQYCIANGSCPAGFIPRDVSGLCFCVPEYDCTPDCTNRDCGPDPVCGVNCGDCADDEVCENGSCVEADVPGMPCPNGDADCPDLWPDCLNAGAFSYCSRPCTNDSDCGGNNCCLEIPIYGDHCFAPVSCL
jgi:hypothetical protein